jgi:vancomycin resistance protein YoaR
MVVNPDSVRSYVTQLASTVDRPAQNARLDYQAGKVLVLSPRKTGRTLDQADALQQLVGVIKGLTAHARLRFKVQVTQPPIDVTNPASLGIDTLLGAEHTSFQGAPPSRLSDITNIASRVNKILLPPNQDISFTTLVGPNWSSNTFIESERDVNGRLVPGGGGAMQQVATTFFRALYASGLQLEERHAHVHRFGWYEPPIGLDAVVSPATNEDLRFRNNTGKYLFVKTRIEPVRRELWIYLYGPKLGWKVSVDPLGKIVKKYPHGPDIVKQDSSLTPGEIRQTAWAHDGADAVEERTIEYPNGSVRTDQVTTHYQPWQSIILEGSVPTPTPTPTSKSKKSANGTPTPGTATPSEPSPTPTFNH